MTPVERVAVPDVIARFTSYKRQHPEWGALHVVLADGNVRDQFVYGAIEFARERADDEGFALAMILASMSQTQRRKIARLAGTPAALGEGGE